MVTGTALAMVLLLAAELPRGEVITRVEVEGQPDQSYALYLPAAYTPNRAWPMLYALDPGARGAVPVARLKSAAEKYGVIVAGSNNSRNGNLARSIAAIEAMYGDTHQRFRVDDERLYATGFSGGARLALFWAGQGRLKGVVACGAGFLGSETPKQVRHAIAVVVGDEDFNYEEMRGVMHDLAKRRAEAAFIEFPGPHQWPPSEVLERALGFVLAPAAAASFEETKAHREARQRFNQWLERLSGVDRQTFGVEIGQLRKDAARPERDTRYLVARRVLAAAAADNSERAAGLMEKREYRAAIELLERAALVMPEQSRVWMQLSRAYAGIKDTKKAEQMLERARSLAKPPPE